MPELPDLAVVADALHAALAGRRLAALRPIAPLSVRATAADLDRLASQPVAAVTRRGKFLVIALDAARVVVNPMLKGRLQLARPGDRAPSGLAAVLEFGERPGPPGDPAAWTRGADWLPSDDEPVEVRYRDPSQMGKVYVEHSTAGRGIPGFEDEQGPDADDPDLDLEAWQARIRRHPGELKSLLRNQAFVAGIGNAYSDEILHVARMGPFRRRASLAPEEVDALYLATRSVLADAVELLRRRVPPTFETQVRDHLAVHLRGGLPCPRCGMRLSEISRRGEATTWCRGCQR